MQYTIIGAGALGTIVGAHLVQAGHEVLMVARGDRGREIARNGLKVRGISTLDVACDTVEALPADSNHEVLVYAVKTYHMAAALEGLQNVTAQAVFSLANGVKKNAELSAAFGDQPVIGCMANFSGELEHTGEALFTRNVCCWLGKQHELAGDISAELNEAGIVTELSDEIDSVEWSKFVGWVALFAGAVITRQATAYYLSNPAVARVVTAIIREAAQVAAARGIRLQDLSPMPVHTIATAPGDDAVTAVIATGNEFLKAAAHHRMSALQDLEAGRRLEVHETLGYVVSEAQRLGIAAPSCELAYELCAGVDDMRDLPQAPTT